MQMNYANKGTNIILIIHGHSPARKSIDIFGISRIQRCINFITKQQQQYTVS